MTKTRLLHGTILLLLLLLLLLLAACGSAESSESGEQKLELPTTGLSKLVIDHRHGDIQITGSDNLDRIEVVAKTDAKGSSLDKLKLSLEAQKEAAYLDARFSGQFFSTGGSGIVNLEIRLPKKLQVDLTAHRDGDIRISDLSANTKIENINGDIEVSNLAGSLEIDNRDGDLTLNNIGLDVRVDNINGHIQIERVGGTADIDVGDGSLDITQVAKDVSVKQSGSGKVVIGEVKGKVLRNK